MKNIFKAIGGFFVSIYKAVIKGGDPTIIKLPDNIAITPELIDHCINMVNIIKGVVNSPVVVLVTDLTPISLDNEIRLKLADALPAILAGLTYEKAALASATDNNVLVNDLLAKVRLSDDPDKDAFYHTLCARLIMAASDGKVTWSEAVSMLEIYLKQMFGIPQTPVVVTAPVIESPLPVVQNKVNGYQPTSDVVNPTPPSVTEPVVVAAPITMDAVNTAIAAALSQASTTNTITQ